MPFHNITGETSHKSLQLKILSGYLLLVLLVLGILAAVWYEKQMFRSAKSEELVLLEQRRLSNQVFKNLLALFLDSEHAALWDEEDLQAYREKERRVFLLMGKMRNVYPSPLQQARIDTVADLLKEKYKQVRMLVYLPSSMDHIDSLLTERLPLLSTPLTASSESEEKVSEKTKLEVPFGWFKKKSQDYSLHRFHREMSTALHERKIYLENLADSLKVRNKKLNRHINRLVNDFESDAMERTVQRHQTVSKLRERAFILICAVSAAGLLCAVSLYLLIRKEVRLKHHHRRTLEEAGARKQELLEQRKKIMLMLAHDIRGPLNSINGSAELAMFIREKGKRNGHLQNIRSSCTHILHLVNDLLAVYRLNEGKDTPHLVPFHLQSLIERIATEHEMQANRKGLLFETGSTGTDVTVKGDTDRIEQIAGNLLSNALKFTLSGKITFTARYADDYLLLEVIDTGIGMTEEDIQRIFHPFQRAAQQVNAEGFGLGLAITLSLVNLLEGKIDVESEPGKGSRFTVHLPLSITRETVEKTDTPIPAPLPAGRKILAIDDDPMQLHIVQEMLERSGMRCDICIHVRELVNKIRQTDYDLILTDIQMKDTNGFDLLKLLRSARVGNSQHVPVIAMTARGDTRREVFTGAGFTGCLYKPFSMTELLLVVHRHACVAEVEETEKAEKTEKEIDFTVLISESRTPLKTLALFIRECYQSQKQLEEALYREDIKGLRNIIHRMVPLWELVGMEKPLTELGTLLREEGCTPEKIHDAVGHVVRQTEHLIRQAEKQIKSDSNERNPDC